MEKKRKDRPRAAAQDAPRPAGGGRRWSRLLIWPGAVVAVAILIALILPKGTTEPPASPPSGPPEPAPAASSPSIKELLAEEIALCEELLADYPLDPRAIGFVGNTYSRHGNQEKALEHWRRALALNPNDAHGYDAMATVAFLREEHEQAAELWRKAAALDPALPGIHHRLGQAAMLSGNAEEAIAEFEKDLAASPRSHESAYFLGQLRFQRKQYAAARESYERAIALSPAYTKAHYGRAMACARLGQAEESRQAMEAFTKLKATDVRSDMDVRSAYDDLATANVQAAAACAMCGDIYAEKRNLKKAEARWLRAASLDRANTACRASLATLCRQTNRVGEALRWCEELRALEPRNPLRHLNAGILHAELKQFAAAEEALRAVCELAPERPEGFRILAQVYLDQGREPLQAVELARKAVALGPAAEDFFVLGRASAAAGDRAGAAAAFERAATLDPGNPQYRDAHGRFSGRE